VPPVTPSKKGAPNRVGPNLWGIIAAPARICLGRLHGRRSRSAALLILNATIGITFSIQARSTGRVALDRAIR